MNFLWTPNKGKVEKHVGVQCIYCKKVFKNHQALGGHLRIHKEEIKAKRSRKNPRYFSNSVNTPQPISLRHPEIFFGGAGSNPSTLFTAAASPLDISKRFYSKKDSCVHVNKFYQNNTSTMPSKFFSSSGHADIQNSEPLSFIASSSSGSNIPTSVPFVFPFCQVANGVCQFNTNQFRSLLDGMPSFSLNAFPYFAYHNYGMIPYFVNAVTGLHPGLSPNQSPGFKEPNTVASLPPHPSQSSQTVPTSEGGKSAEMMNASKKRKIRSKSDKPPHLNQSSGQGKSGRFKTQTVSTSEGGKRLCSGKARGCAEMMNASKKRRINSKLSMETDKPPHPSQSSCQDEVGRYKTQTVSTSDGGKRRCLSEARGSVEMVNALKKPKINSKLSMKTDEPPKRELLLFKDVENCFSGSGNSNAEEEGQTDLDLTLHL